MTSVPSTRDAAVWQGSRVSVRDIRPLLLVFAAVVILLDHITKRLVVHFLAPGQDRILIPHVLRLTHVLNSGAAFSVLAESAHPENVRSGLIAFSCVAVLVVLVLLWRAGRSITLAGVALSLILGGAIGNLYDRIHFHYVIDFIAVRIIHYDWPDFNLADSCIVTGACLLMLEALRSTPDDHTSRELASEPSPGAES